MSRFEDLASLVERCEDVVGCGEGVARELALERDGGAC